MLRRLRPRWDSVCRPGLIVLAVLGFVLVGTASAAPGGLDASFGSGGVATASFSGGGDAYGIAIQPDDRIVVAGSAGQGFGLARFTAAGTLDPGFGSAGKVTTAFAGATYAYANAVVLQPDGRIVAGGAAGSDLALARYNANGSLDTSFGGDGKVTTAGGFSVRALLLQDDGKIVAVGSTGGSPSSFLVVRYTAAGALDTTFGAGGKVTTSFHSASAYANAAVLQADGKIVAAGSAESGSAFALARYTAQGALDTTFGTAGKVTTTFGTGASALVLQANGKLLAGGDSSGGFSLARYTAAGALDSTFGTGGKVTTAVGSGLTSLSALALQQNGKVVAGGFASNGSRIVPVLVRYSGIGSLDTTFGTDGKVTTAIGTGDAFGNALALQGDGKILLGGASVSGSNGTLIVARYLSGDVPTYTLSVAGAGAGEGIVASRPAGISCGDTCSADFAYGTRVTLTPTAFYGSRFTGWSGGCSGTGSCTVALDGDQTVTATFDPAPNQTLTVATAGHGHGTVTSDPQGIGCSDFGGACSTDFLYGTSVTLTAAPDADSSSFTGWSGACSGTGSCTVTMSAARSVTATFAQLPPKRLTLTVTGGSAYDNESGSVCDDSSSPCVSTRAAGSWVYLWPSSNLLSYAWTGCTDIQGGFCLVRMTQDRAVRLTYQAGSTVRGTVLGPDTTPLAGSPVSICTEDGRCAQVTSAADGRFAVRVGQGTYRLTAGPPAGSFYVSASAGPISLTGAASDVEDVILRLGPAPTPPPEDTTITPVRGTANGVPLVYFDEDPVRIETRSCPGGSGSFEVVLEHSDAAAGQEFEGQVVRSGRMVEATSGSGDYHGTFPKFNPLHGVASVHIQIDCPNGTIDLIGFGMYIDPSGVVSDASTGRPIAGATVTLTRFSSLASDFVAVPNGSAVMSPSNRSNPDTTGGDGKFAWDVVAGLYKVTATAPGCSTAETEALAIPPPATGLVLGLDCRPVLTARVAGTGSGTVASDPGGIHCTDGTCTGRFSTGTSVALTATPDAGSTFTGWSGACTGTGTCTLRLTAAKSVTATFAAVPQTLTVTKRGTGTGTVTSSPAGISCGSTCSKGFAYGTSVTLTATPAADSTFTGWSGACTGTGTCTLTMSAAKAATATFAAKPEPVKPQRCVVPKVKGKKLAAAKAAIKKAHCRTGKIARVYSQKVKKGRVISQKPKAGKRLAKRAKVSLKVSKGKRLHGK